MEKQNMKACTLRVVLLQIPGKPHTRSHQDVNQDIYSEIRLKMRITPLQDQKPRNPSPKSTGTHLFELLY